MSAEVLLVDQGSHRMVHRRCHPPTLTAAATDVTASVVLSAVAMLWVAAMPHLEAAVLLLQAT